MWITTLPLPISAQYSLASEVNGDFLFVAYRKGGCDVRKLISDHVLIEYVEDKFNAEYLLLLELLSLLILQYLLAVRNIFYDKLQNVNKNGCFI